MNRKKIIIIVSVIIILALLGGAFWYYSKKTTTVIPTGTFPGESGVSTGATTGVTGEGGTPDQFPSGTPLPRLYELHKSPVAGAGFLEGQSATGLSISARYIEKGLGYIFETPLANYKESRIVNETRPHLAEALWGNRGNSVIVRYLDPSNDWIIKTHVVDIASNPLGSNSGFLKTSEVFLPDYIPFVAAADDHTNQLFYLENGDTAARGTVATFDGSSVSKVFNASFTEWLPQYPNQSLVTLTTKPSSTVPGYLYFIDLKTKLVTKILSGISGLTTLTNRDGSLVLYASTQNGAPELSLYNTTTKESHGLSLQTLPEKCAWSSSSLGKIYCAVPQTITQGSYPDQWYQGIISFSDDIWEIDTTSLLTKKIMSPNNFKAPSLDIINPTLSSDDEYLLFINKKTNTPWVFQISDQQKFASSPSPILTAQNLSTTTISQPAITPDMKKIK